jgi:hypothetical protein
VDLLVVDFDETATDEVCFGGVVFGDGYDLLEGAGDDAPRLLALVAAHHRVRLAASRLSVRENRSVVAVEDVVDE